MERRRAFSAGDLGHLANLCHNCKGCWHSCQYAPPHEFGLNLPRAFAALRVESYETHAWPAGLGRLFERNGLWVCLATAVGLSVVMGVTAVLNDWESFTGVHRGAGAFYTVIPHDVMVALGVLTFGWAVLALVMGARSYWRSSGAGPITLQDITTALRSAATTRHLAGAGDGCNDVDERFGLRRKHWHMATMWGFLLSFAATTAGTLMHYGLGWEAPYSWYSAPVILGTIGGLGLLVGPAGLFAIKLRADPGPVDPKRLGMDYAFLALLFFTSLTGIALLLFRHTSAMGGLLAIHLGVVIALFLTLPYGKFVHGVYRILALVRDAAEARQ